MWCFWPILFLFCGCGNGCRRVRCNDPRRERCNSNSLDSQRTNIYRCFNRRTCEAGCVLREGEEE